MPERLAPEDAEIRRPHDQERNKEYCCKVCPDDPAIQRIIVERPIKLREPLSRG